MSPVANEINVVGSDARLQRAVTTAIRRTETSLYSLHSATDEERGVVILVRDDLAVTNERNTKLFKSTLNYVENAERRVISLSSVVRVHLHRNWLDSLTPEGFAKFARDNSIQNTSKTKVKADDQHETAEATLQELWGGFFGGDSLAGSHRDSAKIPKLFPKQNP